MSGGIDFVGSRDCVRAPFKQFVPIRYVLSFSCSFGAFFGPVWRCCCVGSLKVVALLRGFVKTCRPSFDSSFWGFFCFAMDKLQKKGTIAMKMTQFSCVQSTSI